MRARFLGAIALVAARIRDSYICCGGGDGRGAEEHVACHAGKARFDGYLRILEDDATPRM
jgi:hypothetical protein